EDVEPEVELVVLGGELEPVGEPGPQGEFAGGVGPAQLAGPPEVRAAGGRLTGRRRGFRLGGGRWLAQPARELAGAFLPLALPPGGGPGGPPPRGGGGRAPPARRPGGPTPRGPPWAARAGGRPPPRPAAAAPRAWSPGVNSAGVPVAGHARGRRARRTPPGRRARGRGSGRSEVGRSACTSSTVLGDRARETTRVRILPSPGESARRGAGL